MPGITHHNSIRIQPSTIGDACPPEEPNVVMLALANAPPGKRWEYPAKDIVDAGFLELVRYGIRRADDAIIVDSLRVVDAYGQRSDSGPFIHWGVGRAWPLLTGERGHCEIAAGRDASEYIRTLEQLAGPTGLLPEQVWDEADRPDCRVFFGRPTRSVRPLMWAHAEYIKLLRHRVTASV